MRKSVTLHPETVQKAAELAENQSSARRQKRGGTRSRPKNSPVRKTTVDPKVWRTALKIADGNSRRIKVESATSVVVKNR